MLANLCKKDVHTPLFSGRSGLVLLFCINEWLLQGKGESTVALIKGVGGCHPPIGFNGSSVVCASSSPLQQCWLVQGSQITWPHWSSQNIGHYISLFLYRLVGMGVGRGEGTVLRLVMCRIIPEFHFRGPFKCVTIIATLFEKRSTIVVRRWEGNMFWPLPRTAVQCTDLTAGGFTHNPVASATGIVCKSDKQAPACQGEAFRLLHCRPIASTRPQ